MIVSGTWIKDNTHGKIKLKRNKNDIWISTPLEGSAYFMKYMHFEYQKGLTVHQLYEWIQCDFQNYKIQSGHNKNWEK